MKYLITSAIMLFLVSPFASAHHKPSYTKAKLIDVTPLYEYVIVKQHTPRCSHIGYPRPNNATVIGSVIGGSIGHATSDKRHKAIGTIAGAIIGGAIGHRIDHKVNVHPQKYCAAHSQAHNTTKQRVLQGYNVTYKIKGRIYQTFSKSKPNRHIRIYH